MEGGKAAEGLEQVIAAFIDQLSAVDVARVAGGDARRLLGSVARAQAAISALESSLAHRIEVTNAHVGTGSSNAAMLIAAVAGCSARDANDMISTGRRLEELDATASQLRSGNLSYAKAREVARGAGLNPESEASLLETASENSFDALRRQRMRSSHELVSYVERRKRRYLKLTPDGHGYLDVHGRLCSEDIASGLCVLGDERDRVFREARRLGVREGHDAYMADAFCHVISKPGRGRTKATVNVIVDHRVLQPARLARVIGVKCRASGQFLLTLLASLLRTAG